MRDSNKQNRGDRAPFQGKGKRGLLKIIFGRTTVIVAVLILQIVFLLIGFHQLNKNDYFAYGVNLAIALIFIVFLLNNQQTPSAKIPWIFLAVAVPIVGVLLYVFIEANLGYRMVKRNLNHIEQASRPFMPTNQALYQRLQCGKTRELHNLATYARDYGGFPIFEKTDVRYFSLGEEMFQAMLEELEKAQRFIFLEFYILAEGQMWRELLELLARKVREGVEVRVMYDGMCAFLLLPYTYPRKLRALGIKAKMFLPVKPFLSTHYNHRDHRKILVIDGEVAFTGGINISDEYINLTSRYGHWKDTGVMLQGEGALSFTLMFLQMWHVGEAELEDFSPYLRTVAAEDASGYVLPYGGSPLGHELLCRNMYLEMINQAQAYLYIMTPYMNIDHEMLTALTSAAKRSVEVCLILPHICDHQIPFALTRSHYRQLMSAGIRIYEYTPGFTHGKMFVSDDCKAIVGTVNLDFRSLYHHFECAVYLQDTPVIAEIKADFDTTIAHSQLVDEEQLKQDKIIRRIAGRVFRIFSPLL